MNIGPRVGFLVAVMHCAGYSPAMAQAPGPANAPASYECAANAHCNVSCQVDGEKVFQTGSPKTISMTMLAPNNYVVELVEQSDHVQFIYLAGTKVVCNFDGVTKKGGQ
jgi:hypothetical protein